jgi:DNA-binding NtrC family response regulator
MPSETILLVDDDHQLRELLARALEREGYRLLKAEDVLDALRLSLRHQEPIHLLLTDVVMPMMSGWSVYEFVSSVHPETKVLYISGHSLEQLARRPALRGNNFLQKPFSIKSLHSQVRKVLDSSPA